MRYSPLQNGLKTMDLNETNETSDFKTQLVQSTIATLAITAASTLGMFGVMAGVGAIANGVEKLKDRRATKKAAKEITSSTEDN